MRAKLERIASLLTESSAKEEKRIVEWASTGKDDIGKLGDQFWTGKGKGWSYETPIAKLKGKEMYGIKQSLSEAKGSPLVSEKHKFNRFMVVKQADIAREPGGMPNEDAYVVRCFVVLADKQGFHGKKDDQKIFTEMFVVTSSSDKDEVARLKGAYKWPIYSGESDPVTKAKKEATKLVKKL